MSDNSTALARKKLAKIIRRTRRQKGLTQQELADKMGVTQPYVSKLEKGDCMPEFKTINRLAESLGIDKEMLLSVEDLQYAEPVPQPLPANEQNAILQHLLKLENIVKEKYTPEVVTSLSHLAKDEKTFVKEVDMPVGAGECFTSDEIIEEHALPRSITYGATHMLRVRGQSMEPFVMDSDILLIVPQSKIEYDGQMAIVNVGSQVNSVKFVYIEKDHIGLGRSRTEARWYPREEVRIQGIVVGKISTMNVIKEFESRAMYQPGN